MMAYKRQQLSLLVNMIKLWPAQNGILHGVIQTESLGQYVKITTYCNRIITVKDSRRSRSARWLRNKWAGKICNNCHIPEWKVKRYSKGSKKKAV